MCAFNLYPVLFHSFRRVSNNNEIKVDQLDQSRSKKLQSCSCDKNRSYKKPLKTFVVSWNQATDEFLNDEVQVDSCLALFDDSDEDSDVDSVNWDETTGLPLFIERSLTTAMMMMNMMMCRGRKWSTLVEFYLEASLQKKTG